MNKHETDWRTPRTAWQWRRAIFMWVNYMRKEGRSEADIIRGLGSVRDELTHKPAMWGGIRVNSQGELFFLADTILDRYPQMSDSYNEW